ncbi:hypothetical protein [Streptomyces sp. NPDC008150]|uniref:hypothetical protein n=1 Tax=Streptomyces sp. NPDC008150 TaxID=3364816 RepID=UPI0036E5DDD5
MAKPTYHFVITLHYRQEGAMGSLTRTLDGVFEPQRGDTRETSFKRILTWATEQLHARDQAVLFFALERNDL